MKTLRSTPLAGVLLHPPKKGELKIEWWPISRPKPYAKNPRRIPQIAVDKVASSLAEFGWQQPIVVDAKEVILAGHTRLLAAYQEKQSSVPVVVARNLTAAQARAYRLMDNRSNQESSWDMPGLSKELGALKGLAFALDLTGFDSHELDELLLVKLTEQDEAPPLPAAPTTRIGDLWLLGAHRVLCGDATNQAAVEYLLGERRPQLMVTDPPYGVEYDPEWRKRAGVNNSDRMGVVKNDDRADWREAWAHFAGAVAYVWHGGLHAGVVRDSLAACGFEIRSQIIWAKPSLIMGRGHYHWQHEPCWYAVRGTAHWTGDRKQTTLWYIDNRKQDSETIHSTQKPVECMRRAILNHTTAGEYVYDPFLGSGTTLVACEPKSLTQEEPPSGPTLIACEISERKCLGLELDPRYVDVIVHRWQNLTGKEACLDTGETFESVARGRQ